MDRHGNGHWSLESALSTACVSVSKSKLVEWTEYLIDNVYTRPKKHFKNEQRSRDAAAKKRANTSGVGKINNYCEDIYIPP